MWVVDDFDYTNLRRDFCLGVVSVWSSGVLLCALLFGVVELAAANESDNNHYAVKRGVNSPARDRDETFSGSSAMNPAINDYVSQAETLKDLPGVYLFTDYLYKIKNTVAIDTQLPYTIEERFRNAGIKIYSREGVNNVVGQPEIQFYLSVTESGRSCCISMWMALLQGSTVIRDPNIMRRMGTWGSGGRLNCEDGREKYDLETMILTHVDKFIDDHKRVNATTEIKKVKITGTYSNRYFVADQIDAVKMDVRLVLSEAGNYALTYIDDGLVRAPQLAPFELDGKTIYFVMSNIGKTKIGGRYTGTITPAGMILHSQRNQTSLFLPRVYFQ